MMNGKITIRYLQEYIKAKDNQAGAERYFLKLTEEVGELARALLKNPPPATPEQIKGTVEEELWDVIYYALAIANTYDIDLETWIPVKEALSNAKYGNGIVFDPK